MTTNDKAEQLAREINELSPANRLRLAADLIEARKFDLAQPIVEKVALEMGAVRLFATAKGIPTK